MELQRGRFFHGWRALLQMNLIRWKADPFQLKYDFVFRIVELVAVQLLALEH